MANNQKGSAAIVLLVVLVVILAGVLVYFAFLKKPSEVAVSPTPTATVTAMVKSPAAPSPLLPITCKEEPEGTPVITLISPISGPIGTKARIDGCNLSGFEADLDVVFVRSDGKMIPLYGGTWHPRYCDSKDPNKRCIFVTVQSYCESGFETGRYSGITSPCETVKATPGVYRVYVTAWGKKSNEVNFTIR